MIERMWDYHEKIDTVSTSQEAKTWTERSRDSKLNEILRKLDKEVREQSENTKLKILQKLQNLLIRWEYSQFQKEIWVTNCNWKLWIETLNSFDSYLDSRRQWYTPIISDSRKKVEEDKDKKEAEDLLNSIEHGETPSSSSQVRQNSWVSMETLRTDTISKDLILKEWPSLNILWKKLEFDLTSKLSFIKPHLDDLNQLPTQSLLKLKKTVKSICISDKTVTSWKSNQSLLWVSPRGYTNGWNWRYVWGCFRGWTVYAWRYMRPDWRYYNYEEVCGDNKEGTNSLILHEIWHAFDEKYEVSTRPSFKNFHKRFYNKIWSYFQQWGPWWSAGCSEFFAESSAEFHKWWKEKFTKYYSQDFYDYMKGILC